jgi:hypothetical protein
MDILTTLALSLFIFGMAKWCDEGETQVGNIYLRKDAVIDLWVGLYTDATEPAEDATLSSITELPVANNYARIALTNTDWTEQATKGVFEQLQKTFTASGGDWGSVYGYFLADCASGTAGKLVAVEHFSDGPYTVNDGWSVKVTPKVTIT